MNRLQPIIGLTFILSGLFACNKKPVLWPSNGSRYQASYYELNIEDTSKILNIKDNIYHFIDLVDSTIKKQDTIFYKQPSEEIKKYFINLDLKSQKSYTNVPRLTEYYVFENNCVKLAGYSIRDSLLHVTKFSNPLLIVPDINLKTDSSQAAQNAWNEKEQKFIDGTQTQTKIVLLGTGEIMLDGKKDDCFLYDLKITADAAVSFGEKNLVVPGAVILKSKLLYSKTRGLLYEWGIKKRALSIDIPEKKHMYIECIKYELLKN